MRRNYISFFFTYFVVNVVTVFINVYLPVYYFQILNINRENLAFVQIFSYSAFLVKPIISIYFDTNESQKRILAIASAYGIIISFGLMIFILPLLILFGILLAMNFAFLSLLDVSVDKFLVKSPKKDNIVDKNIIFTQVGAVCGTIFTNIAFLLFVSDIYKLIYWNNFTIFLLIGIIPIGGIIWLLREKEKDSPVESEPTKWGDIDKKSIVLMSLFIFLVYGDKLYEYPLEPWILEKFGEHLFAVFVQLLILMVFINLIGLILAGVISKKFNRKKILIISSLSYGLISLIVPFVSVLWFFLLFGILQIIASFIIINMMRIMINLANKKVTYFQVMAAFVFLAQVIFVPLGTYLSAFIVTESIIILSGILIIGSVIPLLFL
ncbi:MAG: hypothetical protein R6U96_16725 [Promethearchaeia archaeon]